MSEILSPAMIKELKRFKRLIVGFSGGLDSSVLLHALSQNKTLKSRIVALHINHQISPHAEVWSQKARAFCDNLAIECVIMKPEFDKSHNLEAHAREARYQALSSLATKEDAILTAHHQNDQAETFLLRLCRGSGIDGLKAMSMQSHLNGITLFRPFLYLKREAIEHYAALNKLAFIHDESNDDTVYRRNFIRHDILPTLEQKWPAVVDVLSRTASLMEEGLKNLNDLAEIDLAQHPAGQIDITKLLLLSEARQKNLLRYFLKLQGCVLSAVQLQTIQQDVIVSKMDANPCFRIGHIEIRRYQNQLSVHTLNQKHAGSIIWKNFPERLICDFGRFEVHGDKDVLKTYHGKKIEIKFREGGERLKWGDKHRSLKKWMQENKIPPWQRDNIPLLFVDDELVLVVGYGVLDGVVIVSDIDDESHARLTETLDDEYN